MKGQSSQRESSRWSSELAYIIGLLVTDGNLSKDGRHIIMRSSDKDLLHTFKRCLSLSNKISISTNDGYAKKPCYRIQFGNVIFYKWLIKIGLFPAKTYTIGAIKLPKKYFIDFLRGHLDGDGTILSYVDAYNTYKGRSYLNIRVYLKFISASKTHITWLSKKITSITMLKGSLSQSIPLQKNKVPIWTLKFAKAESMILLNKIYYKPDLPSLMRKKLHAETIFRAVVNEKRKKYTRIDKILI